MSIGRAAVSGLWRHPQNEHARLVGEVQLVDLDSNALLLRRTVTFRGDTDTAFQRAAEFVGETLKGSAN